MGRRSEIQQASHECKRAAAMADAITARPACDTHTIAHTHTHTQSHTHIARNFDTHLYSFFFNAPSFSHPAPPCPTRELLPLMPKLSDKLFAIFFAIQPVWKCEYLLCSGSGRKVGSVAVALYAAI